MSYTLGQAAKATGKNKSSIHRAIKTGVMSATRRNDGTYLIDPAELHRVYPPVQETVQKTVQTQPKETSNEREIELLEREIKTLREALDDLRHRLDRSEDERGRLTLLLAHQQPPTIPRRRFNWLLAVVIALLFTLVAYVGALLVLVPEPTKPTATPQKNLPPAPSEIWKPDSNGG